MIAFESRLSQSVPQLTLMNRREMLFTCALKTLVMKRMPSASG